MYLDMDGKYSAFEELMHYYHFDFQAYYVLALIVVVNCMKAVGSFISAKKGKGASSSSSNTDLLVSILCGIGLAYGMFFQGVLSDISEKYSETWGSRMFILCIVSFILFVIQLIFTLRMKNIKDRQQLD